MTFSGTLVPAHTGQAVYLEREDASGIGFHVVDVGAVDATFSYSIVDTFSDVATCVMRIRVPANSESQGSTSEPFTILVTPASAPLGSEEPAGPISPKARCRGGVTRDRAGRMTRSRSAGLLSCTDRWNRVRHAQTSARVRVCCEKIQTMTSTAGEKRPPKGRLNPPLPVRRIAKQPRWILEDLAPTRAEIGRPWQYAHSVLLWTRIRQRGYTMLGCRRGRTLYRLAREVSRRGIPGALVDCGVWNGGSTALLSAGAPSREVYAFDSFDGLPPPDEQIDGEHTVDRTGWCLGVEDNVRDALRRFRLAAASAHRQGMVRGHLPP